MSKKHDAFEKRLKSALDRRKLNFERRYDEVTIGKDGKTSNREKLIVAEYRLAVASNHQETRKALANAATDIGAVVDQHRVSVLNAFSRFNLDPKQPHHWTALIGFLAEIVFPAPGEAGRPVTWDGESYARLIRDFGRLRKRHPDYSEASILRILFSREPYKSRNLSYSAQKKIWRNARSIDHNEDLAAYCEFAVAEIVGDQFHKMKNEQTHLYKQMLSLAAKEVIAGLLDNYEALGSTETEKEMGT